MSEFDAAEKRTATVDAEPAVPDVALEAPEADAVEQHIPIVEAEEEVPPTATPAAGAEADDADAAEQQRVVDYDEDDYR